MAQARKPAGSPGSTGGQFDHDPKAGTGDLPGLGAFHEEYGPGMMHERVGTLHLDHTDMDDKHLTHFRFRDATLEYMGMERMKLDSVHFDNSLLAHTNMNGTRMTGGGFHGSTLDHVSMRGARIENTDFRNSRLDRVDMMYAYCDSTFTDATLNHCAFNHATVDTPYVAPVSVTGTSFRDADLHGVEFSPHVVKTRRRYSLTKPLEFHGNIDMGGTNLENADLRLVSCPDATITIDDDTRLKGATLNREVAAAMRTPDGTPLKQDELERRGAVIAPDPGEGDFIEFETEHDRERWQSGVSLRDLR